MSRQGTSRGAPGRPSIAERLGRGWGALRGAAARAIYRAQLGPTHEPDWRLFSLRRD